MTRRPFLQGDILEVTPSRLDRRGDAVAEVEGWDVRVSGGIPGEAARVRVVHVSKGGPVAAARFLEPANGPDPARRDPPCPIHGPCGGCGLQQMSEQAALAEKVAGARRHFEQASVIPATWEDAVASPRSFGYRAKTFLLPQMQKGRLVLGARPPRGPKLVDTSGCGVLRPEIERLAAAAREVVDETRPKGLRTVMLRGTRSGETQFTLVHQDEETDALVLAARSIARRGDAHAGFLQRHDDPGNRIHSDETEVQVVGRGLVRERVSLDDAAVRVFLPPTAFCQGNPDVAEILYGRLAGRAVGDALVELYCGAGAAGLLALRLDANRKLVGVDRAPRAIAAAEANARANELQDRCEFVAGPADELLPDLLERGIEPTTLFLNPPRTGCGGTVREAVSASSAKKLLYLSCNAATLARDAAALLGAGWRLESLLPADMFPQTPHLELLAEFARD